MVDSLPAIYVTNDPSPWNLSISASQDVGACSDHVFGPGELLAVEHKGFSIFPEAGIAVSALLLQSLESISLVINLLVIVGDCFVVVVDAIDISVDVMVVIINTVFVPPGRSLGSYIYGEQTMV